jgi:O-antigen/teichoic acid export membrane protein
LIKLGFQRAAFLRVLSGGVAIQALLSASNFTVGLLLVRRTSDAQYGYFVLISTVVMLSVILQGSFIQPPLIIRLTRFNREERADLVGGLIRDQSRLLPFIVGAAGLILVVLQLAERLTLPLAVIIVTGTLAVLATLRREFFRLVLFAYSRPNDVLKGDLLYCMLLVAGAYLATLTAFAAAAMALTLAASALIAGAILSRVLRRHEAWNPKAPAGKLREIAHEGSWSSFGGGVHWIFSQGYNYLVAGTLDVSAVAALAATRLLVMPVALLSTGIGSLMLPAASKWMQQHRAQTVLNRLALFATALAAMSACYLLAMWLARDWIFGAVLHKHFADRDVLVVAWSAIAIVTVFRDQLLHFLVARARFRLTSTITLLSAVLSLSISFTAMRSIGVIGALLGLLAGEVANLAGLVVFSMRVARNTLRQAAVPP